MATPLSILQVQCKDFIELRKSIMKESKYSKWDSFQSILLFVISCLYSFLEHTACFFLYLWHCNEDHEKLAVVCPPLDVAHAYPHYIVDFGRIFPSGSHDDPNQVGEPREAKNKVSSPVLDPTSLKAQHRYIPLKLPQVLHDFPPNHYEYLPVFDGESNVILAEKHI
jgi:hypothetical protein